MANIKRVTNRSASLVVYSLPEQNIRREFRPGESRFIDYDELVTLSYRPGGRELMEDYLQVESTALDDLQIHHEPEYNMTDADVVKLLQYGSIDELLDCLDFAPAGVIELVKALSVQLPVNDMQKREIIKEKTGFDITAALRLSQPDEPTPAAAAPERRAEPIPEIPHRRTSGSQYTAKPASEGKYKVVTPNT